MARDTLFLHEEIMLLALRDSEGTTASGTWYSFAVGGAVLAELLMSRSIRLVREGKKEVVELSSSEHLGDPLIDECLDRIRGSEKRETLQTWATRVGRTKGLRDRVAEGLCRRGILRDSEDKILLIFSRKIYPEIDPRPERELIRRLHRAIFTECSDVDPRTIVLVALASKTGVLNVPFDKKELGQRKDRIERITKGEATSQAAGQAAKAAVDAAVAATIVTTVIMPTIIT